MSFFKRNPPSIHLEYYSNKTARLSIFNTAPWEKFDYVLNIFFYHCQISNNLVALTYAFDFVHIVLYFITTK